MIIRVKKGLFSIVLSICIILFSVSALAEQKKDVKFQLPIIMYHHISEKSSLLGDYVISPAQFENDIKYLSEQGYKTVTAKQLIDFETKGTPLYDKSVIISFDDGYESFYAYAFDILKKYNFTAILSVIGKEVDKFSQTEDHNIRYSCCTWSQLKEMQNYGIEIGNHTYDLHIFGSRQGCKIKQGENETQYKNMLFEDITKLQDEFKLHNIKSDVFAYPFGKTCAPAKQVVDQIGFKITLGCEEKVNLLYGDNIEELKNLYRFNRPHGKSSQEFFKRIKPC